MKTFGLRMLTILLVCSLSGGIAFGQAPSDEDGIVTRLYLPLVTTGGQASVVEQTVGQLNADAEVGQNESERDEPPSSQQETITVDLLENAQSYAADYGVPVEEALRRLQVQGALAETLAAIETATRDRFAGAWLEHTPAFRLVVRLTGSDKELPNEARSLVAQSAVPIEWISGAQAPLSQLVDKLAMAPASLRTRYSQLAGVDIDVKSGEVVLFIEQQDGAKAAQDATAVTIQREAQELLGLPVRVEVVDAPAGDGHTRGGAHLTSCTSGFVVRHPATGTTGYITAGHCGNTQTYFEYGGVSYASTFISEIRDADQDVQWHTTSHPEYPHFYADSTTSYRLLQAQLNRSGQVIGGFVCHRGKTTGYSCGTIASKTFQPTWANACFGVTCASVWIRVQGANLKCYPGDSGGPWFLNNTAYGIYKGQSSSGPAVGNCNWAVYSAADYFGIPLLFN